MGIYTKETLKITLEREKALCIGMKVITDTKASTRMTRVKAKESFIGQMEIG